MYTGWWFGTFFIFPYIGNFIIPTDELIFFGWVETANQISIFSKYHVNYGFYLPDAAATVQSTDAGSNML